MLRAEADVLILGAGLAGLRAAQSARRSAPAASVLVACPRPGPSGSSFANRNDALGVQVPGTDAERRTFVEEVLAMAAPGRAEPRLVEILAEEAEARFRDLQDLGLAFDRTPGGDLVRHPGCFSPHPRACVFRGLAAAHAAFRDRTLALGAQIRPGLTAVALLPDAGRVCGALFLTDGGLLAVRAGAVVLAAGGPAPLYREHMAGPANPGFSYALLAAAGAAPDNAGFLQIMWTEAAGRTFVNPADLLGPEAVLSGPDGSETALADLLPGGKTADLERLRGLRRGHCPAAYGREDAALDLLLARRRGPDGTVRVRPPGGPWTALIPAAHAGNGGAAVDEDGRTAVPGLYACGECATGMHGANRLGGAMVLATQVFGARAGAAAAREAARTAGPGEAAFAALAEDRPEAGLDPAPDPHGEARIRDGMQAWAVLEAGPGLPAFREEVAELAATSPSLPTRLRAASAALVAGGLLRATGRYF